jgi:hypothetical protein
VQISSACASAIDNLATFYFKNIVREPDSGRVPPGAMVSWDHASLMTFLGRGGGEGGGAKWAAITFGPPCFKSREPEQRAGASRRKGELNCDGGGAGRGGGKSSQ